MRELLVAGLCIAIGCAGSSLIVSLPNYFSPQERMMARCQAETEALIVEQQAALEIMEQERLTREAAAECSTGTVDDFGNSAYDFPRPTK